MSVGVNVVAALSHDAQAVAIAIKCQAQLSTRGFESGDQVFQVLRLAGVWVVVGEVAVHLAEQLNHVAAQSAKDVRRSSTSNAVAAIDHHFHGAAQAHIAHDARHIGGGHVHLLETATRFERPALSLHDEAQALNFVTINGAAPEDHLETVVVLGVVTARHLNATFAQRASCEIQHGCGYRAHVNHLHACGDQATNQSVDQ